jgi:hypothetical protein
VSGGAILRRVVRSPKGGWDVRGPRSERPLGHFTRKREAERLARNIVRESGAGSVAVYGADGVVRFIWTFSGREPAVLTRGKVFDKEVAGSWGRRNGGTHILPQHTVQLGWHPELAPDAGKLPKGARREKGATGRLDILVEVDPEGSDPNDAHQHAYRALLEVKSTLFDGVPLGNLKRTIARHRRQIVDYIGTQLDLEHPDAFEEPEAFVAPGVIYAHKPSDPALKTFVEDYFGAECISVVWEDQRRLEDAD